MKVVFLTNYYNHHQKPLADALYARIGDGYAFIETSRISEERLRLGYGGDEQPPYIRQWYASDAEKAACQEIIDTADVVIAGSAPLSLIQTRLRQGKLTFLYTERIYKSGVPLLKWPVHLLKALWRYVRYRNLYVLCASAYTPLDFSRLFAFIGKTYKWGYFPAVKRYENLEHMIEGKQPSTLLWTARFIDWKHPEHAVEVAKRLKADGVRFTLRMIGNGVLEDEIRRLIERETLTDCVELLGSMTPEQVREHMEKSEIFLFTSDRNEGWGAVLNESMNSACAVVANSAIGSAPFLLEHGENGYLYEDGNLDDLYAKVKRLLEYTEERKRLGTAAYHTMTEEWNAENAATRLLELSKQLLDGAHKPFPFASGVCSKADILKDGWFTARRERNGNG